MIGSGRGATWRTGSPGLELAEQPLPADRDDRVVGGTSAQSGGSSAATGARIQPGRARATRRAPRRPGPGRSGSPHSCSRPSGRSMFTKTGPCSSGTRWTSTPASRRRSSSVAVDRLLVDADDRARSGARGGPSSGRCTRRRRPAASRAGRRRRCRATRPTTDDGGHDRGPRGPDSSRSSRPDRSAGPVRYWPSIPSLPDRSRRVFLRTSRGRRGGLLRRPARPRRRDGAGRVLRARPDGPPAASRTPTRTIR